MDVFVLTIYVKIGPIGRAIKTLIYFSGCYLYLALEAENHGTCNKDIDCRIFNKHILNNQKVA
jgi:hypothetical protein